MLEDVGALLPIALGLGCAGAGAAAPASRIRAVRVLVLLVVPQLLLSEALSAHISERGCKGCQVPSRLASWVVSEQLPE
jgi:hypothetical protein